MAAQDEERERAWRLSHGCEHCSGSGQATVYDPAFDGLRVRDRPCLVRGEVVERPMAMVVAAHCVCPMGRWMRGRTEAEMLVRVPDFFEVLEGRSRWVAVDPTGNIPGHAYRAMAATTTEESTC